MEAADDSLEQPSGHVVYGASDAPRTAAPAVIPVAQPSAAVIPGSTVTPTSAYTRAGVSASEETPVTVRVEPAPAPGRVATAASVMSPSLAVPVTSVQAAPLTPTSALTEVPTPTTAPAPLVEPLAPTAPISLVSEMADDSLETIPEVSGAALEPDINPRAAKYSGAPRPKLLRFNRSAFVFTLATLLFVSLTALGGFLLFKPSKQTTPTASQTGNFAVGSLKVDNLPATTNLGVGEADKLVINGQLQVNNGLILTPTDQPTNPSLGQFYLSNTNNQVFYYNGNRYVSLATDESVAPIAAQQAAQRQISQVGSGLALNGATLTNTGVVSIRGTAGQIEVSSATGDVQISLPTLPAGGLIYGGGAGGPLGSVPTGAGGKCLISNGAGSAPTFQNCPGIQGNGNAYLGATHTTNTIAMFGADNTQLTDSLLSQSGATVTVSGNLAVSGTITGNGSGLSSLNGSSVTSGTIADARLSTNVALLNATQIFGGSNTFTNTIYANGGIDTGGVAISSGVINGQTIGSAANFTGTVAINGLGATGSTALCLNGSNQVASCVPNSGSVTLQQSYNASVNPELVLNSINGALTVRDNLAPLGANLLEVQNNAGTTTYLGVSAGGISVTGAATVSGAISGGSLSVSGASSLAGGLSVTGNSTISGSLTGLTALSSAGTITFSGLSAAGIVHNSAAGVLSTSAVLLGTDTSGSYVANLGSLTGLTATGNSGAGSTPTLSVVYGNGANTAAQGNTALSFTGSGNLTGTVSGTAGGGFTTNTLTVVNSPSFSGDLAVQGAGGITVGVAGTTAGVLKLANGLNLNLGSLQTASLGQATTYTLPDPAAASATICLSTGNCAGAGGGITGSGTVGALAKFNGTGSITSSTLSEAGTTLTASGNVVIQGANSLALGTSNTADGSITFRGAIGLNTVSLQAPATNPASNLIFKLPASYGSSGYCLQSDGTGGLSFQPCTGGPAGGVTSLDGQTGVLTLANSSGAASVITIDNASTTAKGIAQFNATNFTVSAGTVNTVQDIATGSAPTFSALTLQSNTTSLSLTGTPAASATSSLVRIGAAIAGGDASLNGGTYLGLNAPATGAGSAADFLNFQSNGVSRLKVANSGAITAGSYNGQTISSAASFSGTLSVATGYQIGGAAASGNFLRGNGTNFVASALQTADIPSGSSFYIQNGTALQTTANFNIQSAAANSVVAQIRGATGQTSNLLQFYDGAGVLQANIGSSGSFYTNDSIASGNGNISSTRASAGNNSFTAQVAGDALPRYQVNADGRVLWGDGTVTQDTNLYRSAAATLKTDGNLAVQGATTLAGSVTLSSLSGTAGATAVCRNVGNLLSTCLANANGVTLQQAYDASAGGTTPEILLDASRGGLTLADAVTPLGTPLLEVTNNAGTISYLSTTAVGTTLSGNLTVSGTATLTGPLVLTNLGAAGSAALCYNGSSQVSSCAAGGGGSNFIVNGTALQTNANFNIQSAAAASVGGIIRGATSQTADLLQLQDSAGTILTAFNSAGRLVFGPSGAQDTNLYRSAAATLKTDGSLDIVGSFNLAVTSATAGQITQNGSRLIHTAGGATNFFAGTTAGNLTVTGTNNTGVGSNALAATSTGATNTALGAYSLYANTTGYYNTATGVSALQGNTIGNYNTANGVNALASNTTGLRNSAFGQGAGYTSVTTNANTTGSGNTFIGYNAGPGVVSATSLQNATAIGTYATVNQNDSLVLGCLTGVNGCTATTKIGIAVAAPTATLSLNAGTTAAEGIAFGTDTNLYRSSASTLKTDGALIVGTLGSGTTALCSNAGQISTCSAGGGGTNYIVNGTSLQTTANFNIQSAAAGSVGGIIRGAVSQTADLLQIQNSAGTVLSKFDSGGNLSVGTSTSPTGGVATFNGNVGIGTAAPTEKLSVYNGNAQIDYGNLKFNEVAAPSAPTVAVNPVAGNLTGNYQYQVTFVTAQGETNLGAASAVVSPAAQQVNLTAIPTGPSAVVTARKLYRTLAGGSTYYYLATLADNTTTVYTDNLADASLTVVGNAQNTTAGRLFLNGTQVQLFDSASANTTLGYQALGNNTSGTENTATGFGALQYNTSGYWNTASGSTTLRNNTTGNANVAFGAGALQANTTGSLNTASGTFSLYLNTTGNNNIAFGYGAGRTSVTANANTTGSNNTFIGYNAGPGVISATSLQNATAIGTYAVVNQNDSLVLGCLTGVNGCTATTKVGIGTAAPTATLDVRGTALFQNTTNSTTAFQIQDAAGTSNLFRADTLNNGVGIGRAATTMAGVKLAVAGGVLLDNNSALNFKDNLGNGRLALTLSSANNIQLVNQTTDGSIQIKNGNDTGNIQFITGSALNTVASLSSTGQALFKNGTNSTTAFQVQNASGLALLTADTTGGEIELGQGSAQSGKLLFQNATNANTIGLIAGVATSSYNLTLPMALGTSGQCLQLADGTGTLTFGTCGGGNASFTVTSAVNANDVVVIDTNNAQQVTTTSTYGNPRVFGIATQTQTAGVSQPIVTSGKYQVTADTAAVAIGDFLVTSSTTGMVTSSSNPALGTVIGRAMTAKAAGASGLITIQVTPGAGGNSTSYFYGTGGTVTYSGGYTIHTFTSSGTFIPSGVGNVEYLIVGGGGSGAKGTVGVTYGGGGGGGGVQSGNTTLSSTTYAVTVGAGGAGSATAGTSANGSSSSVFGITAAGGSGGNATSTGDGGTSGAPQSNSGCTTGCSVNPAGGGGGGGAAATSVNGGTGYASSIIGSAANYAGGGGSGGDTTIGAGGSGGGGNGAQAGGTPVSGAANTGGGGGGMRGDDAPAAGSGGSGVVIIRYLTNGGTSSSNGAGAGQISYTEYTSNVVISATTEATANTVVTAPSYTYDGATPIKIEFYSPFISIGGAGNTLYTVLYQDGVAIGQLSHSWAASTNFDIPGVLSRTFTPSAGTHTYSIRAFMSAGTGQISAGTGGAGQYIPGYIRITPANGGGNATTLQGAYDMGRMITTTDSRDINFTLADTTTDSNFILNVATGSTGQFQVQGAGVNSFTIDGNGWATHKTLTNSATGFQVQNAAGSSIFAVDTSAAQAVFGKASTVNGKLTLQNSTNANTVGVQSGATTASYNLTLPTAVGTSGQCLKLTDGTGTLGFADCGSGGGSSGSAASYARVYNNATLTNIFASGVWSAVTLNSETQDTDGYHDTSANTSRMTVPTSGFYQFTGHIIFSSNTTGKRGVSFRVNGGNYIGQNVVTATTGESDVTSSTQVYLNAGDYVEMVGYQDSGTPLSALYYTEASPYFSVSKVSGGSGGSSGASGQLDQARAYKSTSTAIAASTQPTLTYDSERFDNNNLHDNITNPSRFTIKHAGTYQITGQVVVSGAAYLTIMKNGAVTLALVNLSGVGNAVSTTAYLNAGDYVELTLSNQSAGTVTIAADDASTTQYNNEFSIAQLPDWMGGTGVAGSGTSSYSGVEVYNNATLTGGAINATWTAVTFNSERQDTAGYHDTSANTSRLVAPVSGMYYVHGSVSFVSNATGIRGTSFKKNGGNFTNVDMRGAVSGTDTSIANSTQLYLNAGDYVEMWVYQNSGANLDISYGPDYSPNFGMTLMNGGSGTSSSSSTTSSSVTVPMVRAFTTSSAQSIPNTAWTSLALNSESFDTDTMHDTVTNNSRITFKTAGTYTVTGQATFASNATGVRMVSLLLNGSTGIANSGNSTSGSADVRQVTATYAFNAGDYVETQVYQSSGAALALAGDAIMSAVREDGGVTSGLLSGGNSSVVSANVYNTTDQIYATGNNAVVNFNSERQDTNGLHDTTTNTSRLVAPVSGTYDIKANIPMAISANATVTVDIRVNGVSVSKAVQYSAASPSLSVSSTWQMNTGDYAEVYVLQNSGANATVTGTNSGGVQAFSMTLIGGGGSSSVSLGSNTPSDEVRAYNNADQAIANNTSVMLALNAETYDSNTMHDTVTNNSQITFKKAGTYSVGGKVRFGLSATGTYRQLDIVLNGSKTISSALLPVTAGNSYYFVETNTNYRFNAGDYIQLRVAQDSGGVLNVVYTDDYSPVFTATMMNGGTGNATTLQGAYDASANPAKIQLAAGKPMVLQAAAGTTDTNLFQIQKSDGTAFFNADTTNGRIGIGTTAPAYNLDLSANTSAAVQLNVKNTYATADAGGGATIQFQNGVDSASLGIANPNRTTYGALTAGTTLLYSSNSAGIALMSDNATASIRFATGGSGEKVRIDSAGNVGIGTSTPISKISVRATGAIALPATSGATQSASIISLEGGAGNQIFHIGLNSANNGIWLQNSNIGDLSINYPLLFNPNGGNVGIGTAAPGAKFEVKQSSNGPAGGIRTVRFDTTGYADWFAGTDGNAYVQLNATAYCGTTGGGTAWACSSDERKKDIQGGFTRGLNDLAGIDPIMFRLKTAEPDSELIAGFSAQNVLTAIPEAVGIGPDGQYTVSDRPILAAAINAIQQLDTRTKPLEGFDTANVVMQGTDASFSNLNVSGNATVSNLTVVGAATVGTLNVTGSAQFSGDITVGGHVITAGGVPTAQVQAAAGTGATVTIDGNDTAGTITITTGNGAVAPGDLAKIIFSKAYGKAPRVILTGQDGRSAASFIYPSAKTATDFVLRLDAMPLPNTSYVFDYFIAE